MCQRELVVVTFHAKYYWLLAVVMWSSKAKTWSYQTALAQVAQRKCGCPIPGSSWRSIGAFGGRVLEPHILLSIPQKCFAYSTYSLNAVSFSILPPSTFGSCRGAMRGVKTGGIRTGLLVYLPLCSKRLVCLGIFFWHAHSPEGASLCFPVLLCGTRGSHSVLAGVFRMCSSTQLPPKSMIKHWLFSLTDESRDALVPRGFFPQAIL